MRRALARLPLKLRLVAGFTVTMLVVLLAAAAFVFWRVRFALDRRIDADLATQAADLRGAVSATADPVAALARLGAEGRDAQILSTTGTLLAAGSDSAGRPALVSPAQLPQALRSERVTAVGTLLSGRGHHLRVRTAPVRDSTGRPEIVVAVERLDQRDEALGELLVQLAVANGLALVIASFVGFRLARAALTPVEDYRREAQRIARGDVGVRLAVPAGPRDEVSRLGHTLNEMLDAQELSTRRQQQFIDDASHDLRTPLSVLAAEVDVALAKHRSAEELEQALIRLRGDIAGLAQLADDLLTLGAQGGRAPVLAPTELHPLLDEVATRARDQLRGTDRQVTVTVAHEGAVHVDEPLVLRVLGNLVDNAVRHGDGTITLSAEVERTSDHLVTVLRVADDGLGMDEAFLAEATGRFRRGESSREGGGSGLGLAIAAAIVEAHHGQLRICSRGHHHHQPEPMPDFDDLACATPGGGTVVTVALPVSV